MGAKGGGAGRKDGGGKYSAHGSFQVSGGNLVSMTERTVGNYHVVPADHRRTLKLSRLACALRVAETGPFRMADESDHAQTKAPTVEV